MKYQKDYQEAMKGIKGKEIHLIFLGDSHASIIGQDILNPFTYNLAFSSDTTREMYLKLRYALANTHGIRYLFLEADPHILCKYHFTTENKSFIKGVVSRDEFNAVFGKGLPSFAENLSARYLFLSSDVYVLARKKLLTQLIHGNSKPLEGRDNYACLSQEDKIRDAKHRSEDHFSSGPDADLMMYYQKIIKLCHDRKIRVIGIRYPVSKEYLDAAQSLHWPELVSQINQLGLDDLVDYSRLFTDPAFFENTDHINLKSATILINQMRQDMPLVNI